MRKSEVGFISRKEAENELMEGEGIGVYVKRQLTEGSVVVAAKYSWRSLTLTGEQDEGIEG